MRAHIERPLPARRAMAFFFYGTLMDAEMRRLVLGSAAAALPARLMGYRRMAELRSPVPVLARRPGAAADGVLVRGIDRRRAARLRHYEGCQYRLACCMVELSGGERCRAFVFLARAPAAFRHMPWRLDAWQRRWRHRALKLAALWLASYRAAGYETRGRLRWVKRWAARD